MTSYKFECSHWLKFQHSDWRANLVKELCLQIDFPPMRALEFIRGHMIFKLCYDQIYQMKTTLAWLLMLVWKPLLDKTVHENCPWNHPRNCPQNCPHNESFFRCVRKFSIPNRVLSFPLRTIVTTNAGVKATVARTVVFWCVRSLRRGHSQRNHPRKQQCKKKGWVPV